MKRNILRHLLVIFIFGLSLIVLSTPEKVETSPFFDMPLKQLSYTSYVRVYYPFNDLFTEAIQPNADEHIYVIEDATDLYHFSLLCNGSQKEVYLSLHYVLGDDIDYSVAANQGNRFRPIGFWHDSNYVDHPEQSPYTFQGTFDGRGFTIQFFALETYNLFDNYYAITQNELKYYSMFSVIGETGVVKNVSLISPNYVQPLNYGLLVSASYLAGVNYGTIENTSVVDLRTMSLTGIEARGFIISGLVYENYGIFRHSFIASPKILRSNISPSESGIVNSVLHANKPGGTIEKLYYDCTLQGTCVNPPAQDADYKLETSQFSSNSFFRTASDQGVNAFGWFLSASNYPSLKGFLAHPSLSNTFYLRNSTDLLHLTRAIDFNLGFQNHTYILANDLDMEAISSKALKTPITAFAGTLEALTVSNALSNNSTLLYSTGRDHQGYLTILNLTIGDGSDLGDYAGFGLFGFVSGTIRNINLFNVKATLKNQVQFGSELYLSSGTIASRLVGGSIQNVHIAYLGTITGSLSTRLYHGGLVGSGNGTITNSSVQGEFLGGTHTFEEKLRNSAVGGFIGHGGIPETTNQPINIENSVNWSNLTGIGFSSIPIFDDPNNGRYTNVGGFIGTGLFHFLRNLTNQGNVISHSETAQIHAISIGGIIGFGQNHSISSTVIVDNIINEGDVSLIVNRPTKARVAVGFGVLGRQPSFTSVSRTYRNLTNRGTLHLIRPGNMTFTEAELRNMDLIGSGLVVTHGYAMTLDNVLNESEFAIDVSLMKQFSGVHLSNVNLTTASWTEARDYYNNDTGTTVQSNTVNVYRVVNAGHISGTTTHPVYHRQIKLSGVALGKHQVYLDVRNEGNVSLEFLHNASDALTPAAFFDAISNNQKNIMVVGVGEQITGSNRRAERIYNRGTIQVTTNPLDVNIDVKYHVYVSGLFQRNLNTRTSTLTSATDTVRNLLNDGYIIVNGRFNGNIYASGIVSINSGIIQSAINTADIYVQQQINTDGFYVDASGIAANSILNSVSGQIWQGLNYGDVYAKSNNGFVSAAGIVARNNRSLIFTAVASGNSQYLNAIRHSINYGTISAYNSKTTNQSASSIAGGILGEGWMRIDNTLNYGKVNSNYFAGGIVGHLDMFTFANFTAIQSNIKTGIMANLINYGAVRRIDSPNDVTFSIEDGLTYGPMASPQRSALTAFGGIIGHIHVGSSPWEIDNDPIDGNANDERMNWQEGTYRDWLNFDSVSDVFGNLPAVVAGSAAPAELKGKFYTIKDGDNSPAPFNGITYYPLHAEVGGVFHTSFPFMQGIPDTPTTINFIQFLPTNRFNLDLLQRLGLPFDPNSEEVTGIYALGPLAGIGLEGLYLPDNFNLSLWNNTWNPSQAGDSWQEEVFSGGETLRRKVMIGMKQLSKSYATNIERIQLYQEGNPSITLSNAHIDLINGILTFYVAHNSPAAQDPNRQTTVLNDVFVPARIASEGNYSFNELLGEFEEKPLGQGTHVKVNLNLITSTTPRSFLVNTTNTTTYTLGYKASFTGTEGTTTVSYNVAAKIQRAYGEYSGDGTIRSSNGVVLESIEMQEGIIRVYSEAYDPSDELTYRDYKIRLVRLPSQEFSSISSLSVDGLAIDVSSQPMLNVVVPSTNPVNYKPVSNQPDGQIELIFNAKNISPGTQIDISFRLRSNATNNLVNAGGSTYSLTTTNLQTINGFDPETGLWDDSTYRYLFTVNAFLPAGLYTIEVLITNSGFPNNIVSKVQFEKEASPEAFVTTLTSAATPYYSSPTLNSGIYLVSVPYGMVYNLEDPVNTLIMNFSNYSTLAFNPDAITPKAIQTSTSSLSIRPSNLSSLILSPRAALMGVSILLVKNENTTHTYTITIHIRAEDGTVNSQVLIIEERLPSNLVDRSFLGVNTIANPSPLPDSPIVFARSAVPLYRFEFKYLDYYTFMGRGGTATFTTSKPEDLEESHYHIMILDTGFSVEFHSSAVSAFYNIKYRYDVEHIYPSDHPLFSQTVDGKQSWAFDFQEIEFQKEGNHESRATNIFFTNDSVSFDTLTTIIHPLQMNVNLYENLLNNIEPRSIIVVPRGVINYNQYTKENLTDPFMGAYYVIGQVANTDLSYYFPIFEEPTGAKIRRVLSNGTESEFLVDNFEPLEETEFKYVKYIIYAENYEADHPVLQYNYSEYFVGVQDTTNNIYLQFEIRNKTSVALPYIMTSLTLTTLNNEIYISSFITSFQSGIQLGTQLAMRPTQSGRFMVWIHLPIGLTYSIKFNNETQSGRFFDVPATVISRRYTIIIDITTQTEADAWGQRQQARWSP